MTWNVEEREMKKWLWLRAPRPTVYPEDYRHHNAIYIHTFHLNLKRFRVSRRQGERIGNAYLKITEHSSGIMKPLGNSIEMVATQYYGCSKDYEINNFQWLLECSMNFHSDKKLNVNGTGLRSSL